MLPGGTEGRCVIYSLLAWRKRAAGGAVAFAPDRSAIDAVIEPRAHKSDDDNKFREALGNFGVIERKGL